MHVWLCMCAPSVYVKYINNSLLTIINSLLSSLSGTHSFNSVSWFLSSLSVRNYDNMIRQKEDLKHETEVLVLLKYIENYFVWFINICCIAQSITARREHIGLYIWKPESNKLTDETCRSGNESWEVLNSSKYKALNYTKRYNFRADSDCWSRLLRL